MTLQKAFAQIGFLILITVCSTIVRGQEELMPVELTRNKDCSNLNAFANCYTRSPHVLRGLFWRPFGSLLAPGLDQYIEGRIISGVSYTSYAALGFGMALHATSLRDRDGDGVADDADNGLESRDNLVRQEYLGQQMYQTAGSLSAYQAYRSAIQGYQARGQYSFLKHDEKTSDLILAPFDLRFFLKPTSFIPVLGLTLLMADAIVSEKTADKYLSGSDAFYGTAFSLQAGVGEEAIFRGYLMPQFHQAFGNSEAAGFWANSSTALLFSLAHLSEENKFPIWQFGLGWYMGWVSQKNDYSLKESVFIHTWWDIVAFLGGYLLQSKTERELYLPILSSSFD